MPNNNQENLSLEDVARSLSLETSSLLQQTNKVIPLALVFGKEKQGIVQFPDVGEAFSEVQFLMKKIISEMNPERYFIVASTNMMKLKTNLDKQVIGQSQKQQGFIILAFSKEEVVAIFTPYITLNGIIHTRPSDKFNSSENPEFFSSFDIWDRK